MLRQFNQLNFDTHGQFDLLVIGGGITGAWTAYDAARRGLKVAVIDRTDWASGTSSASSKMIHGGLRYLENLEFSLVKHSLAERRTLARIAPHQLNKLRLLIPIYGDDRVGRAKYKMGLVLYDSLAGGNQPVDKHVQLSGKKILERYPFIKKEGLVGGFTYGDCQEDDARLTYEIIEGAHYAGAVTVNHASAEHLIIEDGVVCGAAVKDKLTGEQINVRAHITVNAAGPWSPELLNASDAAQIRRVKGVHLVMPPMPARENFNDAMFVTSREDGRVLFAIPWYGQTLLGTTDSDYSGKTDDLKVNLSEIDYLIAAANNYFEEEVWTRDDVRGAFAGLRTLKMEDSKSATKASRDWCLEQPYPGLLMPLGGKYTTARDDAEKIVNEVVKVGSFVDAEHCTSNKRPLPWCPLGDFDSWQQQAESRSQNAGLDNETAYFAVKRHGRHIDRLLAIVRSDSSLAERIAETAPFCWAEVINAARREMAVTLDDIMRRRMPLAVLTRLTEPQLQKAASLAGRELGWNAAQQQEQVLAMQQRYSYDYS